MQIVSDVQSQVTGMKVGDGASRPCSLMKSTRVFPR